jgi:hypothetical protein
MSVEERVRDACERLRIATDSLGLPEPHFAKLQRHRHLGAPAIAVGVIAAMVVVALGFAAINRDNDTEGRLSTEAPTATTFISDPEETASRPRWLPKFVGTPAKTSVETLNTVGLRYEIHLENGADIETGRVLSQDIPPGIQTELAPLIAAGRTLTLRVGPSLAVADDEIDVGLTGDAPKGKWRVVASQRNTDYCLSVFNQTTYMTGCLSPLSQLQNGVLDAGYNANIGVYGGSAPAGTTAVELVDGSDHVVATATLSTSASPPFQGLTFWAAVASEPSLKARYRAESPVSSEPKR